jgi:CcmD family protein
VNETTAQTSAPGSASAGEALALRQLQHVGAAYAVIFALILVYAWRMSAATKRLSERIDDLEREGRR